MSATTCSNKNGTEGLCAHRVAQGPSAFFRFGRKTRINSRISRASWEVIDD